jgi:hypothetical protein
VVSGERKVTLAPCSHPLCSGAGGTGPFGHSKPQMRITTNWGSAGPGHTIVGWRREMSADGYGSLRILPLGTLSLLVKCLLYQFSPEVSVPP